MTEDSLVVQVRSIVAGILALKAPDATGDPLSAGRLDSISMVRLLAALEEDLAITIPPEEIAPGNFTSIEALARMIERLRRP